MDADNIKQQLLEALGEHEELWEWIKRLDDGVGTYNEVSKIAEIMGDDIAGILTSEYSEELLEAYMKAGHSIITDAGVQAQRNLNDAAHIGIEPKTNKYPKAKVQAVADEISQADAEAVAGLIQNAMPTLTMGMVDTMVKYNADFLAEAGMNPIIVRTWSGRYPSHDTKHSDWCHDLAGTYKYHEEPKNVYVRHAGCRCRVEFFPSPSAKGRITALSKGEVDRDSVLWNTRPETLERRLRRAAEKK